MEKIDELRLQLLKIKMKEFNNLDTFINRLIFEGDYSSLELLSKYYSLTEEQIDKIISKVVMYKLLGDNYKSPKDVEEEIFNNINWED